jgi:Tol biopolymer transport system component
MHVAPNQLVRFPQWQDTGHILAVVQEPLLRNGTSTVVYTLERIDASSGAREKLLNDVLSFGLSPDGKRAVYARLVPGTGETLNAIDLGAVEHETTLVGLDQNLSPFQSPRYSPDGGKVAFASADQVGARARFEYVSAARVGPGDLMATRALDGLPEDIWTVDANGGSPVRVADLKEDLPGLAWSGDGKHIYVLGAGGLYDVNLTSGAVTRLGDGVFHGQLAWAP